MSSTVIAMAPQSFPAEHNHNQNHNNQHHHYSTTGFSPQNRSLETAPPPPVCSISVPPPNNGPPPKPQIVPEFDWSEEQQNLLMGGFAIGYVIALLPAARLSEFYGGRRLVSVGGLGHVVLNLVSPLAARTDYWALVGVRVLVGVFHATLMPSFYYMLTRWTPDHEKSKAIAALSVGSSLGTIGLNLVSGYLCEEGVGQITGDGSQAHSGGSWASVFYLTGVVNLVWLAVWAACAHDQPVDHPWIGVDELNYIYANTKSADRRRRLPPITLQTWIRLLRTRSVLATIYVKLTHSWTFNMVQSKLSSYLMAVLALSLEQVGLCNTVYHSVLLVAVVVSGILSDMATKGKWADKSVIRKCFESVATFGTATFMFVLSYTGCNYPLFLLLLSLSLACSGAYTGGSSTIIFDLTTNHAHTLVSMVSTLTVSMSLATPALVTLILNGRSESQSSAASASVSNPNLTVQSRWNVVFHMTALFLTTGGIVFLLFGSARRLRWLDDDPERVRRRAQRLAERERRRMILAEQNKAAESETETETQTDQQQKPPPLLPQQLETETLRGTASLASLASDKRSASLVSTRTNQSRPLVGPDFDL